MFSSVVVTNLPLSCPFSGSVCLRTCRNSRCCSGSHYFLCVFSPEQCDIFILRFALRFFFPMTPVPGFLLFPPTFFFFPLPFLDPRVFPLVSTAIGPSIFHPLTFHNYPFHGFVLPFCYRGLPRSMGFQIPEPRVSQNVSLPPYPLTLATL